ncbi:MAG: hypothetical protein WBG86_03660 [Polyangiales bacterium]
METRKSVRWILAAGCVAIIASMVSIGFLLTEDSTSEEVGHGPRNALRVAGPSEVTRAHTERWNDPNDDLFDPGPVDRARDIDPDAYLDAEEDDDEVVPWEQAEELRLPMAAAYGSVSDLDEATRAQRTYDLVRAELIPEYQGSQFIGLRVGALPTDRQNFLNTIGVSKGDLITSINGQRAQDPDADPSAMFQELSAQRNLDLTIVDANGGEWRRSVD